MPTLGFQSVRAGLCVCVFKGVNIIMCAYKSMCARVCFTWKQAVISDGLVVHFNWVSIIKYQP